MKKLIVLLSMISLFHACKKEPESKRKLIALEAFHEIELKSEFDVFLQESNSYSVEVVADEETIDHIKFSIQDSILRIENRRRLKWRTPSRNKVKLYVNSHLLEKIIAEEGCDIRTITPIIGDEFGIVLTGKFNEANLELQTNTFFYWNNFPAGGKLTLSGEVQNLKLWNTALVSIEARNLTTSYALIDNSSKGDCAVTVLDRLDYSIRGEGNIQLYGNPAEINVNELNSSGRLIKH